VATAGRLPGGTGMGSIPGYSFGSGHPQRLSHGLFALHRGSGWLSAFFAL
jgi:hypothetical protein